MAALRAKVDTVSNGLDQVGGEQGMGLRSDIASLEGRTVSIALANGRRIDDCQLVSCPKDGVAGLWIYANGDDLILPVEDVREVWEAG